MYFHDEGVRTCLKPGYEEAAIIFDSCKELMFEKTKVERRILSLIHGPIRKVFNSLALSANIPMFFGPLAIALTSILTLTPAATVLERAAGNFLASDLCNLIIVLSWISTSLNLASFSLRFLLCS